MEHLTSQDICVGSAVVKMSLCKYTGASYPTSLQQHQTVIYQSWGNAQALRYLQLELNSRAGTYPAEFTTSYNLTHNDVSIQQSPRSYHTARDVRTGSFTYTSVFPCQYHSTSALYSSIHLPPTLYNVFLPALQSSPVSIIPPLLHTHPFIYHPHCIMFFSQHFSFPLSVSFHHCSILIHSSTTHGL